MAGRRLGRGLQFLLSDRAEKSAAKPSAKNTSATNTSADPEQKAAAESAADAAQHANTSTPDPKDAPSTPPLTEARSPDHTATQADESALEDATGHTSEVAVAKLSPNPHQPRKVFREDELKALADSVRESGILQPILVRPREDESGGFEIVAGERRWRAAKRAGLETVPVLVREIDDVELRLFALVENLQRSDLDPIEKARSFRDIKEATSWTHGKIADAVGFERSHVSNFLRLLELDAPIQKHLHEGRLSMGHARALLGAPPERRLALCERVLAEGLSVREVERLAKQRALEPESTDIAESTAKPKRTPAWAREMQDHLIGALGCKVEVLARGKRGRIVLDIGTREEFDRVYELLMSTMPGDDEDQLVKQRKGS